MAIKDINFPFDPDSEEEIRFALAKFFQDLGFTLSDMSFEDSFNIQLGHSTIVVNKKPKNNKIRGRSDILLMRAGKPLAIVETKAMDIELTDDDRDQGLSYARLLHEMAPFTIITNGRQMKIYDTVTTQEIETGADSTWTKNHRKFAGAAKDLQEWAIKTLFSLNIDILRQYCRDQAIMNLSDLKGSSSERRRYDPALYVSRNSLRESFKMFDSTTQSCFAIIGESGIGKTNEICALIEGFQDKSHCIPLFYRATQLWEGLYAAIENDFIWSLQRDEPVAWIIRRFSEIIQSHQIKLYIFIDGIDEFPGNIRNFCAELSDFVRRLDPKLIRLCVTCKSNDWPSFIYEREQLTALGKKIYPVKGDNYGFMMSKFTNRELDEAWRRYCKSFNLIGSLEGETRQESHVPLMLRLIAETYENSTSEIPSDLSNATVFRDYWNRKMIDFNHQEKLISENIVCRIAEDMIITDHSELNEKDILKNMINGDVYEKIIRFGLIIRRVYSDGSSYITFPFGKLCSFIYTVKSHDWISIQDDYRISEEVRRIINTRLGRDALIFYMNTIHESSESWLSSVIKKDMPLFLQAMHLIKNVDRNQRSITRNTKKLIVNNSKILRFIHAYTNLRNSFPELKERLIPYTSGEAGFWVSENFHGYRLLTHKYPQLLIDLPNNIVDLFMRGQLNREEVHLLGLSGSHISSSLWRGIASDLPEAVALEEISKQLARLIRGSLLNESASPYLSMERVYDLLKESPTAFEGTPLGYNWKFLGYKSLEDVQQESFTELEQRLNTLLKSWIKSCNESSGIVQRWYQIQIEKAIIFEWYLDQAKRTEDKIKPHLATRQETFSYLREGFTKTIEIITMMTPYVIQNYKSMIEKNFSSIYRLFKIYNCIDSRLIVEISNKQDSMFTTDYLSLTYIFLPSAPKGNPIIKLADYQESFFEHYNIDEQNRYNNRLDGIEITTQIDGEIFIEKHATIINTKYPDYCIVSNQVYQLIHKEARLIFEGFHNWYAYEYNMTKGEQELLNIWLGNLKQPQ